MSGYVKDLQINVKEVRTDETKKKNEELRIKQFKEDSKLVKGIFKNLEVKGGDLEFAYRKYKEDPIRIYHFEDGKEYEIPMGVAKHINNSTKVPIHSDLLGPDGKRTLQVGKYRERYQFIPTNYM